MSSPCDAGLSEQVLRQKAKWAEVDAAAAAAQENAASDDEGSESGEDGEGEGDDGEHRVEIDPQEKLRMLMAKVVPCANAYPTTVVHSTDRQRVETNGDKWTDIKGLKLALRPANADDCVLLVSNALVMPESEREESHWVLRRGGKKISAKFSTYSRQKEWKHFVCMPYLDQPDKKAEHDYQVTATAGGLQTRFVVSPERQRRQLFAVTLPAFQVAWVEDDEPQSVAPGPWADVYGLCEVVTCLPGDKVLAICTMRYAAQWASELNRGRFTIVRDDVGLDGMSDRGLQSVRALSPNLHRTLLMATVDDPPPGPHLYRVRTALTVGSELGVTTTLSGIRQLALIRLPESLVVGPCRAEGPISVDEGRWTEIPGLQVSIALRRPRDKVLLVYNTDCSPDSHFYEAHFTLFRRKEGGQAENLGFSEDFGLEMVFSDYAASSEYPVGLICDSPGSLGTWTYYLAARVANLGTSRDNPPVTVGHSGSITAVLLTSR